MAKQIKAESDLSTEEKIKEAARVVFTKKGYAGTKTRDIAEEAGLNLALLNYYFRSKEKLFEIVMMEKVKQLFSFIAPALNDEETSLDEKLELIASSYIDMLIKNPDLPIFVLSEIRNNPESFGKMIQSKGYVLKTHFIQQLAEQKKDINPIQFLLNFMSMMIFPFIAKPILTVAGPVNDETFTQLLKERKALIPKWMKMMLE
ncbi:putative HTH-type transcriptional regulator YttP [Pedobacter sp. Bi27]|uniref:TetR/AcrR family transcriptional regulator n=1 Tax=Pedobacter sp. Bi27 TaxID=2822351 RepID=UPI001DA90B8F|nr:TetR family transcriptional regulator [Pedobacter sp. Bi27]CAH0310085.1 putative HTH-type transcriptional regulator YttP [Pedobacter sp. Bi27]